MKRVILAGLLAATLVLPSGGCSFVKKLTGQAQEFTEANANRSFYVAYYALGGARATARTLLTTGVISLKDAKRARTGIDSAESALDQARGFLCYTKEDHAPIPDCVSDFTRAKIASDDAQTDLDAVNALLKGD